MKPRDRETAKGLLPRMEARPRKDGLVTYRYRPIGATKPINLGTDRMAAMRKVLDMSGKSPDIGTINRLWEHYKASTYWRELKPRTQADYEDYSVKLLEAFGQMPASEITAPHVAKYLRVFRSDAPIRANREIALLGNLIGLAIERGEALANPCRGGQVKRNKEQPLDVLPESSNIQALITFAAEHDAGVKTKIGRWVVIVLAAEFAALTGARQAEFLPLAWPAFDEAEVRLDRAKQRLGAKKVDRIAVSEALAAVRTRLLTFQTSPMGAVFPNRKGNVYTASGFASMWQKIMTAAVLAGRVQERFNFHALRAFYATQHKVDTGALPDMHASPTTTAKIYERSKVGHRKAL
jgi:integrase